MSRDRGVPGLAPVVFFGLPVRWKRVSGIVAAIFFLLVSVTPLKVHAQFPDMGPMEEEFLFFSEEDIAFIATLARRPIQRSPGMVSVITSTAISGMAARTLVDVLKTVPGFDVGYGNFGENFLSIRGVDNPTNILFMINGRRFNDFYSGAALYDIPVDGIERVEIIRGPGSALYGTNAMVGAINVIMKKEKGLKVKAGGGTFKTYKANALFGEEKDGVGAYGFFEFYRTGGADSIIPTDQLTSFRADYTSTPARMRDDKQKIQGNVDFLYKEYKLNMHLYHEDRGPNVGYIDIFSEKSRVVSDYINVDLSREFALAGNATLLPRFYADRWKWDRNIQLYPDGYNEGRDLDGDGNIEVYPAGEWLFKDYETWTYGTDWRVSGGLGKSHQVTAGASVENMALRNTRVATNYEGEPGVNAIARDYADNWNNYNFPEKTRAIYAFYLQDEWNPTKQVSLVLGARHDHYSDFGSTTNPRLALSVFPREKVDLKVQYATAFRAPTFKELYDQADMQFYGNPDLKPQKIETFEVGAGYTFREKSFARVNFFRNTIRDDITTLFNFSRASVTEYQNAGTQEITGWETEGKYTLLDGSSVYANLTTFNAKDKTSGTWLTRIPQIRANMIITKVLPRKNRLSLTWMFSDAASANSRTNQEKLPQNRASTGPYHMLNLAFINDGLLDGFRLKFSAFNLLNTDYREIFSDIRYRLPNPSSDEVAPTLIPSNQRAFMLEIEKEF